MKNWSGYTASDFEDYYWDEVAPAMKDDGLDPTEPPTRRWVDENGFGGYYQAVVRHTDQTFLQFTENVLGIERGDGHIYTLSIDHARTKELIYRYAERHLVRRKGKNTNSARCALYAINQVTRVLDGLHDHDNLLRLGSEETHQTRSYEVFLDVFDEIDDEYADRTCGTFHSYLKNFYEYCLRRQNPVDYNPVLGIREDYNWDTDTGEPLAVSPRQVRALAEVAETTEERTLVVLHCAAGIRRKEVARIHRGMLVFDPDEIDTPVIEFQKRKNGPGTVTLVYGVDVLQERIAELEEDHGDDWNGYLFQSPQRTREHMSASGAAKKFGELVERAERETDVDMTLSDGSYPTPQKARRYWYNQYTKGVSALTAAVKDIAREQGSSDADVVLKNYLSKERRLSILRDHMADTLAEAFDGTPIAPTDPDHGETDVKDTVDEIAATAPDDQNRGDQESPIDRFLEENSSDTSSGPDGWLNDLKNDDSGFFDSGGATKAAVAAMAVSVLIQVLVAA